MADAACMNSYADMIDGGFNEFLSCELEFAVFLFKLSCLIDRGEDKIVWEERYVLGMSSSPSLVLFLLCFIALKLVVSHVVYFITLLARQSFNGETPISSVFQVVLEIDKMTGFVWSEAQPRARRLWLLSLFVEVSESAMPTGYTLHLGV